MDTGPLQPPSKPSIELEIYLEKVKVVLASGILAFFGALFVLWTVKPPPSAGAWEAFLSLFSATLGGVTQYYFQPSRKKTD